MNIEQFLHLAVQDIRHRSIRERWSKAGSVSVRDGVIYSYEEPMAFLDNRIQRWVLSNKNWSQTTSRHQSQIRLSLTSYELSDAIRVVSLPGAGETWTAAHHFDNLNAFIERIEEQIADFDNSRCSVNTRIRALNLARSLNGEITQYRRLFDNPHDGAMDFEGIAAKINDRLPAHAALVPKTRQPADPTGAGKRRAKRLDSWLRGKCDMVLPRTEDHARPVHTEGGWVLETTRGAQVPLAVAPVLWTVSNLALEGKFPALDLIGARQVGHFQLERVNEAGDLVIGCHNIKRAALEKTAQLLGLVKGDLPATVPEDVTQLLTNGVNRYAARF